MSFDTYMKIAGITGESTAEGNAGEIELYSFSWGASNPSTVSPGTTGLAAGRVSISSFNVMKKSDKASNELFNSCCSGKHHAQAVVTLRKATGEGGQKPFLTYTFTDVMVDSIQWSGSSGGDDTPTESVSLAFAKCKIEYKPQTSTGEMGAGPVGLWDLTKVAKGG